MQILCDFLYNNMIVFIIEFSMGEGVSRMHSTLSLHPVLKGK